MLVATRCTWKLMHIKCYIEIPLTYNFVIHDKILYFASSGKSCTVHANTLMCHNISIQRNLYYYKKLIWILANTIIYKIDRFVFLDTRRASGNGLTSESSLRKKTLHTQDHRQIRRCTRFKSFHKISDLTGIRVS